MHEHHPAEMRLGDFANTQFFKLQLIPARNPQFHKPLKAHQTQERKIRGRHGHCSRMNRTLALDRLPKRRSTSQDNSVSVRVRSSSASMKESSFCPPGWRMNAEMSSRRNPWRARNPSTSSLTLSRINCGTSFESTI